MESLGGVYKFLAKRPDRLFTLADFLHATHARVSQGMRSISGRIVAFDIRDEELMWVVIEDVEGSRVRLNREDGGIALAPLKDRPYLAEGR